MITMMHMPINTTAIIMIVLVMKYYTVYKSLVLAIDNYTRGWWNKIIVIFLLRILNIQLVYGYSSGAVPRIFAELQKSHVIARRSGGGIRWILQTRWSVCALCTCITIFEINMFIKEGENAAIKDFGEEVSISSSSNFAQASVYERQAEIRL